MTAVPEGGRGKPALPTGAERRALGLLGLSARAGALVSGTNAVRAAVRDGSVHQVVLARNAAPGQRAKLLPLLDARRIPYYTVFTQEELGAATGRPPISAVGFSNRQLAERAGAVLATLARSEDQQGGS